MGPISSHELRELRRVRPWRALSSIAMTWGVIFACFALYLWRPGVLTACFGVLVISGRHMALAVLMHEGAHFLLHPSRRWNERLSQWLCAYPLMLDTAMYRKIHFPHHKHTWTSQDPDLNLADYYPVSPRSFTRKILRDVLGISGLRRQIGLTRLYSGLSLYGAGLEGKTFAQAARTFLRNQRGFLFINGLLFAAFVAAGRPEAMLLLWWLPYLTGFSLVLRLRNIAEHALVRDVRDPLQHSRTTLDSHFVRFFVAPHHANYHLEHHLYPFLPHHSLPRAHRLLRAAGVLERAAVEPSYWALWRRAASADADIARIPRDVVKGA